MSQYKNYIYSVICMIEQDTVGKEYSRIMQRGRVYKTRQDQPHNSVCVCTRSSPDAAPPSPRPPRRLQSLERASERTFGVFHFPCSLLSQEVYLTVNRRTPAKQASLEPARALIPLAEHSREKKSAQAHMPRINHLYNACHIKCYYDYGSEACRLC